MSDRQSAATLHANTDALNEALDAAEQALVRLNLGVTAAVSIQGLTGIGPCKLLVFGKRDSGWGLFVEDPVGIERTPIKSSSREIRCAVAHHLDALHAAMLEAASKHSIATVLATDAARRFIATLPTDQPKG